MADAYLSCRLEQYQRDSTVSNRPGIVERMVDPPLRDRKAAFTDIDNY